MLYALNEYAYLAATPMRIAAQAVRDFWHTPFNPAADTVVGRNIYAAADLFANLTRRYGKPAWRIDSIPVNGHDVAVREEVAWSSPWCRMVHFVRDPDDLAKAGRAQPAPKVLIVAPLSGHYATLLRGTVRTFLRDHDVYVTDWVNAREVPVLDGRFDFYDYADHVRTMLQTLGGGLHVVSVCQPGPPVLTAISRMAEDLDPARPASMIYMGSPIDARLAPTVPNKLAEERPFAWFKSNMIYTVPPPHPGVFRRVYPGMVQLFSFLSMNAERHQSAHWQYFEDLVKDDGDHAAKHLEFYDEYLAVLDLSEEFYLQTIDIVFQQHLLPRGLLVHHGRKVDLAALKDVGLMTVEGEHDDISGVGQTQAAHGLCSSLPDAMKTLYVQPHVGHYGVFNGRRFENEIYPRVRDFIAAHASVSVDSVKAVEVNTRPRLSLV